MNTRSALVRHAEARLRAEERRKYSAASFAVCAFVIGAYLLVAFVAQVAA